MSYRQLGQGCSPVCVVIQPLLRGSHLEHAVYCGLRVLPYLISLARLIMVPTLGLHSLSFSLAKSLMALSMWGWSSGCCSHCFCINSFSSLRSPLTHCPLY